jgi:uncharacterized protein (TIGR00730 family)
MKSICVFCGSSPGGNPVYQEAAWKVGRMLVREGITLVYGGGNVGLMGELANAVLEGGGKVIGVIPQALLERELAHHGVTELKIVRSMHERKALMAELSDAFIALPGGFGTLEELFEILTWAQLGLHEKPCGILNAAGYYSPLRTFISHMVSEQFLKAKYLELLPIEEDCERLLEALRNFTPPPIEKWIERKEQT